MSSSLVNSIAGFAAGITSTLVAHPLELIKTRLQVDQSTLAHSGNSIRLARSVIYHDGLRGLYRGLGVNLWGNSLSWALYFVCYGKIKDVIQDYQGPLSFYDFFIASGAAGALTALCTNPIWVIKTRILSTSSGHPGAYTSVLDGTRQILRSEGLRGFYRGLTPSLMGISHGALQFMAYEQLKTYKKQNLPHVQKELSTMDFVAISGLAKVFAGSATYPHQVLRARLQMYDAGATYNGIRDVVAQMWKKEGPASFYKGLGLNLLRVMPSTWVTFLVYEKTQIYLLRILEEGSQS